MVIFVWFFSYWIMPLMQTQHFLYVSIFAVRCYIKCSYTAILWLAVIWLPAIIWGNISKYLGNSFKNRMLHWGHMWPKGLTVQRNQIVPGSEIILLLNQNSIKSEHTHRHETHFYIIQSFILPEGVIISNVHTSPYKS